MTQTRVLLVEDEPGYARFLREVLAEDSGSYETTWVQSLEDALLQLDSADIVLLDLGLPDADGTEALTRVREASTIPIVVLSALHDVDVALESMRLGAHEYLVKGQAEHALLPRAIRYATERKRLQDTAAAAQNQAEQANAVKDDFLAMLGHELRNPLAPIVTAISIMRKKEASAEMNHELLVVERQVRHVMRLVDDLLDVSRIARGKLDLHEDDVDLADVVDDGVEIARSMFEGKQTLTVDVPRGVLFVHGDRSRLAQVAANLLTNAAKYTQKGGSIRVSTSVHQGFAELRVNDDGIGMEPELLAHVFDRFVQGSRTIDRAMGGLGIGLSIVKSIVALHGGTVTATSDGPNRGSELLVRLPLRMRRASTVPPDAASAKVLGVSRKVLIVDDNEDGREMLETAVQTMGHSTRSAADGASALEIAPTFDPDIALLDIGLPQMDGYELARRLRALFGDRCPKLVAVTGYGQQADRDRSAEAGFDFHLVKPVALAQLERLLSSTSRND